MNRFCQRLGVFIGDLHEVRRQPARTVIGRGPEDIRGPRRNHGPVGHMIWSAQRTRIPPRYTPTRNLRGVKTDRMLAMTRNRGLTMARLRPVVVSVLVLLAVATWGGVSGAAKSVKKPTARGKYHPVDPKTAGFRLVLSTLQETVWSNFSTSGVAAAVRPGGICVEKLLIVDEGPGVCRGWEYTVQLASDDIVDNRIRTTKFGDLLVRSGRSGHSDVLVTDGQVRSIRAFIVGARKVEAAVKEREAAARKAEREAQLRAMRAAVPPVSARLGQVWVSPPDSAEMVYVPAGEYTDGHDPQLKAYLDAFWIDKNLVTVKQYRAFCAATGREMPSAPNWGWKDNHPIVNVDPGDASAYAKWAGKRLPMEAEWEKAARWDRGEGVSVGR